MMKVLTIVLMFSHLKNRWQKITMDLKKSQEIVRLKNIANNTIQTMILQSFALETKLKEEFKA